MNSSIENLSQSITPDCAGIIWLTDKNLNYSTNRVYEFNYLLDGLLTKSITSGQDHNDAPNLFIAQNFGDSFFVGHSVIKSINDLSKIQKHLTVVNNMITEKKFVLIYNDCSDLNIEKIFDYLSNRFSSITFNRLTFN